MSELVLSDCKLWLDQYHLSGDFNALSLLYDAEQQDNTRFGDDTRNFTGGLKKFSLGHSGFWEGGAGLIDAVLFSKIGVSNSPVTFSPVDGADGAVAYLCRVLYGNYQPGATIGELLKFDVEAAASGNLVRGLVMHNATRTSSTNGAARQLGALSATQKLHAALHVISASGSSPTLTVAIESDDNSGMTSATQRGAFAQAVGATSEWIEIAGPITDDWWRATLTIGGTTPSFEVIVAMGIF